MIPVDCSAGALVAQLDRALVYETKGHRFESCRARHSFPSIINYLRPIQSYTQNSLKGQSSLIVQKTNGVYMGLTLSDIHKKSIG